VIHAAAMTNVDRCEEDPGTAEAVNALGTQHVADAAARIGAHLLYVSTDYVFDGTATRPYSEADETNPVSVYGLTKLAGERACAPEATIVRTAWVAGAHGTNFVTTVLRLCGGDGDLRFVADQRSAPTYTADLARALVELALDRRAGCFHVTNSGHASRYELARETVALAGGDPERVVPISTDELNPPRPARRPSYSVLDNRAFLAAGYDALPDWRDGLARLVAELRSAPR
ncbi:MAG TPA: dTDP-4-dehydrorhamnose reductase, partial [Acidimicrobiales bacterium]|nr:dTDP-4-dehydrorhamnose reductase [Acidimicrobiales bacterium]